MPSASISTPRARGRAADGALLIFVTPDGQRTMNTFLGASQFLPARRSNEEAIGGASILYLEGYLWDPEEPRAAMRRAIETARAAGRKVAFTLSEVFVIDRHGDDFPRADRRRADRHPVRQPPRARRADRPARFPRRHRRAAAQGADAGRHAQRRGAVAVSDGEYAEVAAEPIEQVVDTTGAATSSPPGSCSATCAAAARECLRMRRDLRRRGDQPLRPAVRGRPAGAARGEARLSGLAAASAAVHRAGGGERLNGTAGFARGSRADRGSDGALLLALDTGDFEGYAADFAEDGWLRHWPQGQCIGREGLRRATDLAVV
jgi:hypothetical protein